MASITQENLDVILSQSNPPLRQRRQRTNFNEEAILQLDEAFGKNPYPDINEREQMASRLRTTEDRVQVWFQNKRARYRKRMAKENVTKRATKSQAILKKVTPIKDTKPLVAEPITPVSAIDYKFNERKSISNQDTGYYSSFNSSDNSNSTHLSSPAMSFNNMYLFNSTPLFNNSANLISHNNSIGSNGSYNSFNHFSGMHSFYQDNSQLEKFSPIVSPQLPSKPRVPKSIFRPF